MSSFVGWVMSKRFAMRLVGLVGAVLALGCARKEPAINRYYDQHIQPVFNAFCVGNTSPCHRIDPDTGLALGNLDLSSFEGVQKRRDALRTYGSYPLPLLLLKAIPESQVVIPYQGTFLQSEIRHAGNKPLSSSSDAFFELKRWLDNGANRDGLAAETKQAQGEGACNHALPPDRDLSMVDTTSPAFQSFVSDVAPTLRQSCAYATCHSSPQSDFYLTCGDGDDETKFNFLQAVSFIAPKGTDPAQSELLLRPLSPQAGGVSHTGGVFFASRDDETWKSWQKWGMAAQDLLTTLPPKSAGQQFFETYVMPKLLQRGCALEGCHSPNGFNDYRLRPGAQGFFAAQALKRNHDATLAEFMSLDTIDVRQSRAVKKTIFAAAGGMVHRAGSLLESEGQSSSAGCPTPFAAAGASAFCVFKEWHRIERGDQAANVSPMAVGDKLPLVFVARPANGDNLLAFDTFRGGADLRVADATLAEHGKIASVGASRSLLASCPGLAGGDVDVRGPEISYDATKVVFAGRPSAASGLDLFEVELATGACRALTHDEGRMAASGLVKVHNFDPVYAPDGSVVFASTRAGSLTLKTFLPNADLYRSGPRGDFTTVTQMTALLNSELSPAFMQDGRMTFTAEKASPDFYQLSGRRMNWDLTDYHPLLAQRKECTDTFSPDLHPSVGFSQATEIREGLDRNFLFIASSPENRGGAGALAVFNRSIGPFEADRPEVTFLKALSFPDAAATGKPGTAGVYRSPSSLPNGEILASYAANVTDPTAQDQDPKFDLVAVDDHTGARRALVSDAKLSLVEAILGYKRSERALFENLPQLVFGGHVGPDKSQASMHFTDLPMLATLLNANLRRGRNVEAFDGTAALRVYREKPPSSAQPGNLQGAVYVDRELLGSASLEADHSLKVALPPLTPLILELVDGAGKALFTMREEHQVGPGEQISAGVPRKLFNGVCGGCHGSVTGSELDISVTPDALTGASVSMSRDATPKQL
jgi:hypothetical protein